MARHIGGAAAFLALALASAPAARGAEADPGYTLFNPKPKEAMREFNTDRPDKTESPYTVDAGHFQLEADLFNYTKDFYTRDGSRTRAFDTFTPNFKVGLLDNLDLQLIVPFYGRTHTSFADGSVERGEGIGDVVLRTKLNLWGDDGGDTAFGIMPFLKFPTAAENRGNDSYEGGVILPLAVKLGEEWDLGLQTEFDVNRNDAGPGYSPGFVNSATLGYSPIEKLGFYVEIFTETRTGRGAEFIATFDTGLHYLVTPDFSLDAGINIGLTRAADDLNPFVGFAVRF